jgi:hypothetical protein
LSTRVGGIGTDTFFVSAGVGGGNACVGAFAFCVGAGGGGGEFALSPTLGGFGVFAFCVEVGF